MQNLFFDLEAFKKLKEQAEIEYKQVQSVYCPALRVQVIFNAQGFHHLSYNSLLKERSKKIQQAKFHYLKKAISLIQKTTTIQEYRRTTLPMGKTDSDGFRKLKEVQWFAFWDVVSFKNKTRIRTIVRRIGDGPFHFWSVMPFWNLTNKERVIASKEVEDE